MVINYYNEFVELVSKAMVQITRMFNLSIIFIIFALKGGLIFGIFPSLKTCYILLDEYDVSVINKNLIKDANNTFRLMFKESNIIGYIYLVLISILIINITISTSFFGNSLTYLYGALISVATLYFITYLNASHWYDASVKEVLFKIIFLTFAQPITMFLILCFNLISIVLGLQFFIVLPFFWIGFNVIGTRLIFRQGKLSKNTGYFKGVDYEDSTE